MMKNKFKRRTHTVCLTCCQIVPLLDSRHLGPVLLAGVDLHCKRQQEGGVCLKALDNLRHEGRWGNETGVYLMVFIWVLPAKKHRPSCLPVRIGSRNTRSPGKAPNPSSAQGGQPLIAQVSEPICIQGHKPDVSDIRTAKLDVRIA